MVTNAEIISMALADLERPASECAREVQLQNYINIRGDLESFLCRWRNVGSSDFIAFIVPTSQSAKLCNENPYVCTEISFDISVCIPYWNPPEVGRVRIVASIGRWTTILKMPEGFTHHEPDILRAINAWLDKEAE